MKPKFHMLSLGVAIAVTSLPSFAAQRINLELTSFAKADNQVEALLEGQSYIEGFSGRDLSGNEVVRISQTYQGLPIYGESFVANKGQLGRFSGFVGSAITGIEQDLPTTTPLISDDEALSTLLALKGHELYQIQHPEKQLMVWLDENDTAHLAWKVSYVVYSDKPTRPISFIDALSGKVLDSWEGLNHAQSTGPGGNPKTGRYHFGTDYPAFDVTQSGSTCYLDSENVETLDMRHQKSGGTVHSFNCFENSEREVNGAYSPLNDAHAFGQIVFKMYKEWYGIAPIRQKLRMRVHYDRNYENAFWDGQQMTFGDGQSYFYPLVSLDVVSHEVSHGVTQQNSDLEYKNQSGGINEAFSDIAGAAAIYYLEGSYNWKIGDRIKKGSGAMRHMDNPPLDGKSIGHAKDYYSGIDVHHSSGVFNKAFYLLATKPGWDIRKGFDIFLRANQLYWQARSTFDHAASGVFNAASDLGYCVDDVIDAFQQVGVTAGGKTGEHCEDVYPVVDASFSHETKALTAVFSNLSTGPIASYQWDFGDGRSSSQQSPSHTYATSGTYSVSLTVADSKGNSDIAVNTVTVSDSDSSCSVAAWDPNKSYASGDIVSFQGKTYKATWWSTGAQPDLYPQVWSVNGDCQTLPGDNLPPVADFNFFASGLTISFQSTSTDDTGIVSHTWQFGDGTESSEKSPTHTYQQQGSYEVKLIVADTKGLTDEKVITIVVSNDNPTTECYPVWQSGTVYSSGERVSHKGSAFEAKWWTQNEEPGTTGEWGVWENLGPCS
ncbi:PKD domain-containing protein [Grimontia sp. S25]|uniref:PKD domain-containing protein n=1 Tax=Grimontia sedimenti TaxID=2711294 RepID=A0A6M1R8Z2_9GAMM|nr:PKD domain-containing protein [Grimontia sedimenti]NGN98905.1 PKD domain-containing protein [Grimontia sedimenti]